MSLSRRQLQALPSCWRYVCLAPVLAVVLTLASAPPASVAKADPCSLLIGPMKQSCENTGKLVNGGGGGSGSGGGASTAGGNGSVTTSVSPSLLQSLATITDYAFHPPRGDRNAGSLTSLAAGTAAIAFALVLVTTTIAVLRLWAAGLGIGGHGGVEAAEGLIRGVVAVLVIVAWPWLYRNGIMLANRTSSAVLAIPAVNHPLADLTGNMTINIGLGTSPLSMLGSSDWLLAIPAFIAELAAGGELVIVFMLKIVLSATTAALFVLMPLAWALWILELTSWLSHLAFKAFTACLAVPLVWTGMFATFGVVGAAPLATLAGANGFAAALLNPLVAIALFTGTIWVPRSLLSSALGPAGSRQPGFVSRTVSFAAGQRVSAAFGRLEDRVRGPHVVPSIDPYTGEITGLNQVGGAVRMRSRAGRGLVARWGQSPARTYREDRDRALDQRDQARQGDREQQQAETERWRAAQAARQQILDAARDERYSRPAGVPRLPGQANHAFELAYAHGRAVRGEVTESQAREAAASLPVELRNGVRLLQRRHLGNGRGRPDDYTAYREALTREILQPMADETRTNLRTVLAAPTAWGDVDPDPSS